MRQARLLVVPLVAVVAILTATPLAQVQMGRTGSRVYTNRGKGVDLTVRWVDAMLTHAPGEADDATLTVSRFSPADFTTALIDFASVLSLIDNPDADYFAVVNSATRIPEQVIYSPEELGKLQDAAARVPKPDARNRLLKRGALLHSDTALAALRGGSRDGTGGAGEPPERGSTLIQFADGQQIGRQSGVDHWRMASVLLDFVKPEPAKDDDVRLWYLASAAALLGERQLYPHHLVRAVERFPRDPELLLMAGGLREEIATPRMQALLKSVSLPFGSGVPLGNTREELRLAESLLRRSVEADAASPESRIHLAQVLLRLERPRDAQTTLRPIERASLPPALAYYVALLSADAAEALNDTVVAIAAYERAAGVYPRAQPPRLALSRIRGDAETGAALEETLAADDDPDADPWWVYAWTYGPDAGELFARYHERLER